MNSLLPLILMFGVMILLMVWMSSRQRKAQAAQQEKVKALGVGDEVRTHSGFFGIIADEFDDVVILETESGAQTKWARAAIAGAADPAVSHPAGHNEPASTQAADLDESRSADELPAFQEDSSSEFESGSSSRRGDIPGVTSRDDERGSAR